MPKVGRVALFVVCLAGAGALGWFAAVGVNTPDGDEAVSARPVQAFPRPGTPTASSATGVSFRGVPAARIDDVTVTGSRSGRHPGTLQPHPDGGGASFTPDERFAAGERVTVRTDLRIAGAESGDFRFRVATPVASQQAGGGAGSPAEDVDTPEAAMRAHSFVSRPDLRPPKVDVIEQVGEATARGYVFAAPKNFPLDLPEESAGQPGTMIFDNEGRPVWFHPVVDERAMDFRVQSYRGEKVLTWWQGDTVIGYGYGEYLIADDHYRVIARVQAGNGYAGDLHEFRVTPRDTALFLIYNLVRWGDGEDRRPVLEAVVQEVDIESGAVLFEWHSLGHIGLEESYGDAIEDPQGYYDYLHLNSIDIANDGDLLLSGRHTHAVYKVDRRTGDLIWRLGGKQSDFDLGEGAEFRYQHDVRQHPDGTLTVFDNGAGSATATPHERSRAVTLRLNEEDMTARLVREYQPPGGLLATSQGNAQRLPNGNVLVGWGSKPAITEYAAPGQVVYDARFPPKVESYRSFRYRWEGHPASKPAVVAKTRAGEGTTVWVSWNGATEVVRWQLLAGPAPDRLQPVRSVRRDGFETRITTAVSASYVAVRALDASGDPLATSPTTDTGRSAGAGG